MEEVELRVGLGLGAVDALEAGASILIVGGAITKSADARTAAGQIAGALRTGKRVESTLYKRVSEKNIREALMKVSTANISDAAHRMPCMEGIRPIAPGLKLVGAAVTARTLPGDWSKPVQAIMPRSRGTWSSSTPAGAARPSGENWPRTARSSAR